MVSHLRCMSRQCLADLEEARRVEKEGKGDLSNYVEVDTPCRTSRSKSRINNWPTHMIIKFVVIQLDLAQSLRKQIENNWRISVARASSVDRQRCDEGRTASKNKEPISQSSPPPSTPPVTCAAKLVRPSKIHLRICVAFYLYLAIKFALIRLIASGALGEHLNWLDCYVWGRLRFPGRANKIGTDVELGFVILCSVYRLYLAWLASRDELHFPSLEFLLSNRPEDACAANQTRQAEAAVDLSPIVYLTGQMLASSSSSSQGISSQARQTATTSNYNLTWILRPNRSLASWLKLNLFCECSFYCLALILTLVFTTAPFTFGGSIVTDFGYELAYPTCVAWIRQEQQLHNNNSNSLAPTSHIYRVEPPNKMLAHETQIEDLPFVISMFTTSPQIVRELRLFNIARIAFDTIENCALYMELVFQCLSLTFVVLLNAFDAVLNSNYIDEQLELLIGRLEILRDNDYDQQRQGHRQQASERRRYSLVRLHFWDNRASLVDRRLNYEKYPLSKLTENTGTMSRVAYGGPGDTRSLNNEQLVSDITRAQALLHDHFSFVRDYNHFNNFNLATMTLNWTLYTIVLCTWIPSVKSRAIEIEFYMAEIIGTLAVLFFIVTASFVHASNVRLYRQITRLMALDNTTPMTKLRWTSLMKFYFPKPLFCFTLYGSTGISRVFCLKLVTWVASFFVVMANFFYTVRN